MNSTKKSSFMWRLLLAAGALVIGMTLLTGLAACSSDDDDEEDGVNVGVAVPAVKDMPALPAGFTPVADEAEAEAFLNRLSLYEVESDIDDVFAAAATETDTVYKATVTDDTSKGYLKISGTIDSSETSYSGSDKRDIAAEFVADKLFGEGSYSFTILKGSKYGAKGDSSYTKSGGTNYSGFIGEGYGVAYTVTANGKAAKIIFSGTETWSGSAENWPALRDQAKYSGSMKVYGADDASPLYTLNIVSYTEWNEVLKTFNG